MIIPTRGDLDVLLESLPYVLGTTGVELEVVVVSNDTERPVKEIVTERFPERVRVLETGFDAGFCRAVNHGFATTSGDFVLVSNPDVFVTPTYVETLVRVLERRPRAAVAAGKILRWNLATSQPIGTIDTAGLCIGRNRRVRDRCEGEPDTGQVDVEEEVFGISGAALVGRRSALVEAAAGETLLDETFFMYKDDTDLSWRLRLLGWECWYVPSAVAYHGRTSRGGGRSYRSQPLAFLRAERRKPAYARAHSMKNQWLMLVKNEDVSNLARDLPFILARELLVLGYNAVLSPSTLAIVKDFGRALPAALRRRKAIKRRQLIAPRELRRWFE